MGLTGVEAPCPVNCLIARCQMPDCLPRHAATPHSLQQKVPRQSIQFGNVIASGFACQDLIAVALLCAFSLRHLSCETNHCAPPAAFGQRRSFIVSPPLRVSPPFKDSRHSQRASDQPNRFSHLPFSHSSPIKSDTKNKDDDHHHNHHSDTRPN